MKYLKIHKLIWMILVLIFTIFQGIFIYLALLIYVIWNFNFPRYNWWAFWIQYREIDDYCKIENKSDRNFLETVKRRYKFFD